METTVAITLSHHVQYEGYGTPITILFERTGRENINEFTLRIFRSLLTHYMVKSVRWKNYDDGSLFIGLSANIDPWETGVVREGLKKYFATIRIPLINKTVH